TAGFLQIRCRRETARYSCANNDDVKLFSTVLHQISLFTHRTLGFLLDLLRKSTGCSWNTTPTVPADLIFAFLRKGMMVVLGLISSKIPQFEAQDQLWRRIRKRTSQKTVVMSAKCQCATWPRSLDHFVSASDEARGYGEPQDPRGP